MTLVHGWRLPPGDKYFAQHLDHSVKAGRGSNYQSEHRAEALRHVKRFREAVDVGAHVGFWCRDLVALFKHVHAFEPSMVHADLVEQNAPGEIVHRLALGHEPGTAQLFHPLNNSGAAFIAWGCPGNEDVEICTLDSFSLDDVDYIKLDCEGFELPALYGAIGTITRNQPVISLEQKMGQPGRFDEK